jgi:DNA-binding LytR/AlgR family response regulator
MDPIHFKQCASLNRPEAHATRRALGESTGRLTTQRRLGDESADAGSASTHDAGSELISARVSVDRGVLSELLNLIGAKRLPEALDLAQEILAAAPRGEPDARHASSEDRSARYRDHFALRTGRRTVFLRAAEVAWIEAGGNYATFHTNRGAFLLRETLACLSRQLDPRHFVRVHRSTIVNLDEASELRSLPHRDALLRLRDGTQLRIGRTYIGALRDRLKKGRLDQ